ncbi:hypothetical protein BKA93DRAFT_724755 [Sparassis latifolia]
MTEGLIDLLLDFVGEWNQTCCFLHIVNLVAKALLRQFDISKKSEGEGLDDVEQELVDLAKDLDFEDFIIHAEKGAKDTGDEATVDESEDEELLEALFDFTDNKHVSLTENVRPVKLVLVKLCKLAFKIVHLMTITLPAWYATLNDLKVAERIMLRDVVTRWNFTYDMLEFSLNYRKAIDIISAGHELGL